MCDKAVKVAYVGANAVPLNIKKALYEARGAGKLMKLSILLLREEKTAQGGDAPKETDAACPASGALSKLEQESQMT